MRRGRKFQHASAFKRAVLVILNQREAAYRERHYATSPSDSVAEYKRQALASAREAIEELGVL